MNTHSNKNLGGIFDPGKSLRRKGANIKLKKMTKNYALSVVSLKPNTASPFYSSSLDKKIQAAPQQEQLAKRKLDDP